MVNHKHKVIFIHIPKCAGTSIDSAFNGGKPYYDWNPELGVWMQHASILQLKKQGLWHDEYFKFTVIRHPLERLVSSHNWMQRKYPKLSLNQLIDPALRQATPLLSDEHQFEKQSRQHQLLPIHHFIGNGSELDMVIPIQRLSDLWPTVCERIGATIQLPHLNRTSHPSYQDAMSTVQTTVASRMYQTDFDLFSQHFG